MTQPIETTNDVKKADLVINPASKPSLVVHTLPSAQQKRIKSPFFIRKWKFYSFIVLCFIPSILGIIYFGFIASNQYVTEIKFAVRSSETQTSDALGTMTGLPGAMSQLTADSYIVVNYLQSREMVDTLEAKFKIRNHFGDTKIDWYSRFNTIREIEYLVDYWKEQTISNYDLLSNVITVKVRAFTPKMSFDLSESILSQSEQLINQLSQKARRDVMRVSEEEVKVAEERLNKARIAIRVLREKEITADPLKQAGTKQEMIAKATSDLSALNAELSSARRFMRDDAPSILVLKSRQKSIEDQIRQLNTELAGERRIAQRDNNANTVTSMLSNFEELDVERQFAEKALVSALANKEKSRQDADRQQRYLATFVKPSLPQYPLYPRWVLMMFVVFLLSLMVWSIFAFIAQAVKDHIG